MKKLLLEIDGKSVEVLAQKVKGTLWVHYEGKTFEYKSENSLNSNGAKDSGLEDPTQIVAPMPGKVIKIHKQVGDRIQEGETLVTMEAMKMEYNLKAIQDMQVKEILCAEGDNVGLGQKLVGMEGLS